MTALEAAQKYNVSEHSVRRWVKRDGLPHTREGGHRKISIDTHVLAAWLRRRPWMLQGDK